MWLATVASTSMTANLRYDTCAGSIALGLHHFLAHNSTLMLSERAAPVQGCTAVGSEEHRWLQKIDKTYW